VLTARKNKKYVALFKGQKKEVPFFIKLQLQSCTKKYGVNKKTNDAPVSLIKRAIAHCSD
jgi:hypothetical protein